MCFVIVFVCNDDVCVRLFCFLFVGGGVLVFCKWMLYVFWDV